MSFKKILVVTATLGDRDSLSKTVASVNKIGGNRVEHILITPHRTFESIQRKYPYLKVLKEPVNCRGIYPALNYALLEYANKFDYLTFINDDDFWLPNFTTLITTLDHYNDVDVVYGRAIYYDEQGRLIFKQACSSQYKNFSKLLAHNIVLFTQQATLMRSDVFLELNGFDESYKLIGDTDFWIRAIDANFKFKFVNKYCAGYMVQEGQLTSDHKLSQKEHTYLNNKYRIYKSVFSRYQSLKYRLFNLPLYFQRVLSNRGLKTKHHFHKEV